MNPKPTIRELIDACRADHDDPQRPELAAELAPLAREVGQNAQVAAAYERSQHFDRQVRSALDDVPLPIGFAERMLAGCEAAIVTPAGKADPKLRPGISRRKLLLAGFSVAASLLLLVTGGWELSRYLTRPAPAVNVDELAQSAMQWFDEATPAKWQGAKPQTLTAFPIDRAIKVAPSRSAVLHPTVVAYELKLKDGKRATLIVQRTTRAHAIAYNPFTRLPSSGGVALGAWQRNGYVYVLVVLEPDQRLREFIQRPPEA